MEWNQWFVTSWIQFAVTSLLILLLSSIALRWISQTVERARLVHATFLLLTALPFVSVIAIIPAWRIDLNDWMNAHSNDDLAVTGPATIVGQVNAPKEKLQFSTLNRKTTTNLSSESQTASTSPYASTSDSIELTAVTAPSDLPTNLESDLEPASEGTRLHPWLVACTLILSLQLAGSGWFMVVGLLGRIQLQRIMRNSIAASDKVIERWSHISEGRGSRVKVLESQSITTPMTFGYWAPTILLPSKMVRHQGADLDACLAHEWAHIQHKDIWIFTWANLLRIVYWYQPGVHMLSRELRVCQELIADRSAVRTIAEPIQYSELLMRLSVARSCTIPAGALTMGGRTSQLSRRIRALLEPDSIARTRCRFRFNACTGLVVLLLLLGASAIRINQLEATEPTGEQAGAVSQGLRAMTYVRKIVPQDSSKTPIIYRETVVDDGRSRSELLMKDRPIGITSISNGFASIALLHDIKRYSKRGFPFGGSQHTWSHLEHLKNARARATKQFEAKEIDGKKSIGFSILQFQRNYTVWIDEVTEELVQIEFDDSRGDHVAMSQFQFASKVDDSLFLCEVPKGFRSLEHSYAGSFLTIVAQALRLTKPIENKSIGVSKVWDRRTDTHGIANGNGDWFWSFGYQRLDAIDGNNLQRFSFSVDANKLVCVDIEGDGTNEILAFKNVLKAGSSFGVETRRISLFRSQGESIWTYDKPITSRTGLFETVLIADVQGDAKNEVIIQSRPSANSFASDNAGQVVRSNLLDQGFTDIRSLKDDGENPGEHVVITKENQLQIVGRSGQNPRAIAPSLKAYEVRTYESPVDGKSRILAVGFHLRANFRNTTPVYVEAATRLGAFTLTSLDRNGEIHWEAKLKNVPCEVSICPTKPWVAVVQNDVVQVFDLSTGKEIASVPGLVFRKDDAAWVKGSDGFPLLVLKSGLHDDRMLTAYRIDKE